MLKSNIDFLVYTGLKWATAGYGIVGLYINKKWLGKTNLPFAGWLSTRDPEAMNNLKLVLDKRTAVIESGCLHLASIFTLNGVLDLFASISQENIIN